jgi:P-type Ca2+ transporter type 2C
MRTISFLSSRFPEAISRGLSSSQVAESAAAHGRNVLTPVQQEPLWRKLLEKFNDPIIRILLSAALLSMSVDLLTHGAEDGYATSIGAIGAGIALFAVFLSSQSRRQLLPVAFISSALLLLVAGLTGGHLLYEGIAVMIAVFLATGVAFISEYKSDREFELLNQRKESQTVKVLRDGAPVTVNAEDVVVGDVVLLGTGDEIPADGRLITATDLKIDQSLINGESEPSAKYHQAPDKETSGPDQAGCLYKGTFVVEGVGQMIVTEVGDESEFGKIARKLSGADEGASPADDGTGARLRDKLTISKEPTPLQRKLEVLAHRISRVGYVAATIIFVVLIVRGVMTGELRLPAPGEEWAAIMLQNASLLLTYFVYMVIIIVVAVPEGLPMSVTISLALAMRKMTRANSLVRQLIACETIGSATIICTDKTGTLTQNRMQVQLASAAGRWVSEKESANPDGKDLEELTPLQMMALVCALNSTTHLEEKNGKTVVAGNSTEGSLLHWLRKHGASYEELRARFRILATFPFSSAAKRMSVVVEIDGKLVLLAKGAPERIIASCTSELLEAGKTDPWTKEDRDAAEGMLREAAQKAMRTLAFAYAVLPDGTKADAESLRSRREELESNLTYLGFFGISDPLRPDVKQAVDECRSAGIKVQMITGDTIETARAIAKEIGLLEAPDSVLMTSQEFNEKTDDELMEIMPRFRVLARAQPLDKLRMVKLHQRLGEVVAVTGDGTNDAPALKQADVGLSMGKAGTEVAKEASKIVLLDDAFGTIVKAVYWGRALYENIQRFIQFQLTINFSALGISILAPLFGVRPPFTVLQFLWINVIMDTFAAIAICSEPPHASLMRVAPKKRDENILTRSMIRTILETGTFYIVVMLGFLLLMEGSPEAPGVLSGSSLWLTDEAGMPTGLTLRQATIFFTTYVVFQIWNMISCRSIRPDINGLRGLSGNRNMLIIWLLIVVIQALIVGVGGQIFQVEPLSPTDWLAILAGTSSVFLFAEGMRIIRRWSRSC